MSHEAIKTPYLAQAINQEIQACKEAKQYEEEMEKLGNRFGALVRTHVEFPNQIKGKRVKWINQKYGWSDDDNRYMDEVSVESSILNTLTLKTTKRLTGLTLECDTKSEEGSLGVRIKSDLYPFEKPADGTEKPTFTVTLFRPHKQFRLNGSYIRSGFNGDSKELLPGELEMVKEVLTLLENPKKTTYSPYPQTFVK